MASRTRVITFLTVGGLLVMVGSGTAQAATDFPVSARVEQQSRALQASIPPVVDVQVPSGGFPFSLTRYYHWGPAAAGGLLGKGWRLSLEVKLEVTANEATFHDADGTSLIYTKQSDGTYAAPDGAPFKLAATSEGYALAAIDGSQVRNFDKTGRLTTVVNGTGTGLKLSYTSAGTIASVVDAEGRVARFTTNSSGQLIYVTLADGGRVTYVYTNQGYLAIVAGVDGTQQSYTYDSQGRLIN
ncbi:DUF6531 domain-containing protein [Streptomyces misionensis]|nr:DUF6531 domain-containing protein [Streptomyces misionensis]